MNISQRNIGKRIKELRKINSLTQEQLARESDVPYATLIKIESGVIKNPSIQATSQLAQALNSSLDDFLMLETYRGKDSIVRIFEDALKTLNQGDCMFISGIDEKKYVDADEEVINSFIKKLKEKGVTQKLISCEGDTFKLKGDHLEYRWIPKKFFNPTPIYTYSTKVASVIWGPPLQSVILNNSELAKAYKNQFLFMWEHAIKSY